MNTVNPEDCVCDVKDMLMLSLGRHHVRHVWIRTKKISIDDNSEEEKLVFAPDVEVR